jgi:hypothetical protein
MTPLSCDVEHIHHLPLSYDGPDFCDALSYAWGPPVFTQTLLCGPRREILKITPSLDAALRALRLPSENRVLWVDAVCTNQQDNDEKSTHVFGDGKARRGNGQRGNNALSAVKNVVKETFPIRPRTLPKGFSATLVQPTVDHPGDCSRTESHHSLRSRFHGIWSSFASPSTSELSQAGSRQLESSAPSQSSLQTNPKNSTSPMSSSFEHSTKFCTAFRRSCSLWQSGLLNMPSLSTSSRYNLTI